MHCSVEGCKPGHWKEWTKYNVDMKLARYHCSTMANWFGDTQTRELHFKLDVSMTPQSFMRDVKNDRGQPCLHPESRDRMERTTLWKSSRRETWRCSCGCVVLIRYLTCVTWNFLVLGSSASRNFLSPVLSSFKQSRQAWPAQTNQLELAKNSQSAAPSSSARLIAGFEATKAPAQLKARSTRRLVSEIERFRYFDRRRLWSTTSRRNTDFGTEASRRLSSSLKSKIPGFLPPQALGSELDFRWKAFLYLDFQIFFEVFWRPYALQVWIFAKKRRVGKAKYHSFFLVETVKYEMNMQCAKNQHFPILTL